MALQRLTAWLAAGVLALGVSACGGDPQPSASSGTPSGTPSASASASGSASVSASASATVPVLPELAKRHDAVGAKAFVRYWFQAVTYALKTGDAELLESLSSESCKTCRALSSKVHRIYGGGGKIVGGGWEVSEIEMDPRLDPPLFRAAVRVSQPRQRILDADGKVVRRDAPVTGLFFAGVRWSGRFKFLGLERIDD